MSVLIEVTHSPEPTPFRSCVSRRFNEVGPGTDEAWSLGLGLRSPVLASQRFPSICLVRGFAGFWRMLWHRGVLKRCVHRQIRALPLRSVPAGIPRYRIRLRNTLRAA